MPDIESGAASLIRRARWFQFHAKYLWRFHRPFVKRYLTTRCVRCAVSAAYAELDSHGVCAACRDGAPALTGESSSEPETLQRLAAELDRVLGHYAGRGAGAYDALVMLSGGKDSAFLVHELQRRFPRLRLLAFTIDNSFMSPVALGNLRQIVEKLDLDHVLLRPAVSVWRKSFRFACTLAEPGKGCFETADRIDADLSFSLAKIYAAENRIPLLVSGLSWAQIERMYGTASFEIPPDIALKKVTSVLGRPLDQIYEPAEMAYWWDPARFSEDCHPRFVHPCYVWRYEENFIQQAVVNLGLMTKGNDSPLLTNNIIIPIMVVIDYLNLGYASYEPEFAAQVRAGKADGNFWRNVFEMLEYAAKTGWMLDREVEKILQILGLTRAEIERRPAPPSSGAIAVRTR